MNYQILVIAAIVGIALPLRPVYGKEPERVKELKCDPPKSKIANSILLFDSDACCSWLGGQMKIVMGPNMMPADAIPTGTQMVTFVKKLSPEHDRNLRASNIILVEGNVYRWSKTSSGDFDRNALRRGKYFCSMATTSSNEELKEALLK